MGKTSIEWATDVWNPVTGCSKISQGCKNCYAERIANRFWGERKFTDVVCNPGKLNEPASWYKPRRVFVNSMSDLFHKDVPDKFIDQVFARMALARNHTFMILTKRPERMLDYFKRWTNGGWDTHGIVWHEAEELFHELWSRANGMTFDTARTWPLRNVWLGVSAENQQAADERIPLLLRVPAAVHFVSCEPLLGPVDLKPAEIGQWPNMREAWMPNKDEPDDWKYWTHKWNGIQWVVCGGESGPGARPMHPDWARSIRDQCQIAQVPFFFKQWGEWKECRTVDQETVERFSKDTESHPNGDLFFRVGKKAAGNLLDGKEYNEFPEVK